MKRQRKEISPFLPDGWEYGNLPNESTIFDEDMNPVLTIMQPKEIWNRLDLFHPSQGGGFQKHTPGDPIPFSGKYDVILSSGEIKVAGTFWAWPVGVKGIRPHFEQVQEDNQGLVEARSPSPTFEAGVSYKYPNGNIYTCRIINRQTEELGLVHQKTYEVTPVRNLTIEEIKQLTPCNLDGSPIAPEPKVGQVWTEAGIKHTLCSIDFGCGPGYYYLWAKENGFIGPYNTPAEAVEGLTFVREGSEK